ncbi:arsenate reductase (glutaredoxin) [Thiomicrorhabdus arctica]|uniref:arsenate reductase (glutaredoxin) n=1 Tax=Thiomicrorhabdus arctica TaxID=131540 RepID=UPI000380530A|nr:arsenate reductase (glutaredoxin) [Thiomicrorhabdus arctica]
MVKAVIYHNSRCSKSRDSLAILEEKGLEIEEIHYLDTPPSKETLAELCQMMGLKPRDIIRSGETLFKELGLNQYDVKTDGEWLDLLVSHPQLIERPIVRVGDAAIIGRPPENILKIC